MSLINLRQRKNELRAKYKKIRTECPKDVKQRLDNGIAEKFLSLEEYKNCDTLFIFVSSSVRPADSAGRPVRRIPAQSGLFACR